MSDRDEFERWFKANTNNNDGVAFYVGINGKYCFTDIEMAWQAWQAARAQGGQGAEPFAHCFTDVNGKPKEFCEAPEQAAEGDLRIRTPLYTHPHNGEQGGEWRSPSDLRSDIDVRVKLKDGSVIENCLSQSDGDFYWKGGGTEMFILEHEVAGWMSQPPKSKEGE